MIVGGIVVGGIVVGGIVAGLVVAGAVVAVMLYCTPRYEKILAWSTIFVVVILPNCCFAVDAFDELIKLTRQNGTPDLNEEFEKTIDFEPIILNPGDIVLFLNTCPHKSSKNKSKLDRRTLYFTYTKGEVSHYNDYFNDKLNSKNETSKALSGDI